MNKIEPTTIDLIFRRYWYSGFSENEAIEELKNRGVPIFLAKIIEFTLLPFIGLDRYFAILQAEDIDDWDNFGIWSSISTNFFLSLPVVLIITVILYILDFQILEILYAFIAWPIQGVLAAITTRVTFGKWWLERE